ncbi:hypothetical protein GCM10022409_17820 [Hymenobacter glaciei]|uniref:HTH cro/C1-type domain-containing protein n=1 Tax=Hymenobacter glaciei TaxID=877209 RepID=A0ABP7U063_9BACT
MARVPLPSASLETAVRARFGLSVRQLARYLGVSAGFVSHLETGRKQAPEALALRLLPLARLLPPPLGSGPPDDAPPAPGPDADPLTQALALATPETATGAWPAPVRRRVGACRLQALAVAQRLAGLQARTEALAHRRRGLARLAAAPVPPDPAEAARYARWLSELAEDLALAEPNPAAAATARQLLAARLAGLRAEVAALTG